MKSLLKLKLILSIIICLIFTLNVKSQQGCNCIDYKLIPTTNPCCYNINACITNPNCIAITQITAIPLGGSLITGAIAGVGYTLTNSPAQPTFISSTPLNSICPTQKTIGTVCFESSPPGPVNGMVQINFGNPSRPDLCIDTIKFNTCSLPCQIVSPNIECTGTPGKYNFDFTLSNSYPGCTVQVIDLASGSIVPITNSGSLYSGTIMNPIPFSNPANYQVIVTCNGQQVCNMMLQYTLPCCMKTGKQKIECDKLNPGFYNFAFEILEVVNPTNICNVSMYDLSNGNSITPLNLVSGSNMITVSGSMPASTLSNGTYQIVIDCPNSPRCTLNVFYKHPCCNPLSLNDLTVCSNDTYELLSLNGCSSLTGIQGVRWYVNTWPCLGTPIGANPYQVNGPNICNDLVLLPNFFPSSPAMFCIKAEVDHLCFGNLVTDSTNHAKLTLCDPPTVAISPPIQEFCSTSVNPTILSAVDNSSMGCNLNYQWFQNGSIIAGATLSTYQPSGLSYGGAGAVTDGCRSIYNFSVTVSGFCGQASANAQIIIYNENADPGSLTLCSNHTLPLCCDDAVEVCYTPGCIYPEPKEWKWSFKNITTNPSWTNMPYAGNMNPLWLTNKICEDHWYRVESQNGVCPVDIVDIYLPVKPPLQPPIFTAVLNNNNCNSTGVIMTVNYTPCIAGACNYTICWFYNGILVGTTISSSSSSTFTYTTDMPEGNYYAEVKDNDCPKEIEKSNVVTIDKVFQVEALCPCFICDSDNSTMQGVIIDPPSSGGCTYQWYELIGGTLVPLTTTPTSSPLGASAQTNHVGTYVFEVDCNGCEKRDTCTTLSQCFRIDATNDIANEYGMTLKPNPTNGEVELNFKKQLPSEGELILIDVNGKIFQEAKIEKGADKIQLDITNNSSGVYFINIKLNDGKILSAKVIKQ